MGFVLTIGMELPERVHGIQAEQVRSVDCPDCAVIISGGEVPHIVRAAGVMINGDSPAVIPAERVAGIQLITCGRGIKNTVSVTSDDGEALILSLNRAIRTLSGVCEPMELPVLRRGRSDFLCMAEFAAEILLGRIGQ